MSHMCCWSSENEGGPSPNIPLRKRTTVWNTSTFLFLVFVALRGRLHGTLSVPRHHFLIKHYLFESDVIVLYLLSLPFTYDAAIYCTCLIESSCMHHVQRPTSLERRLRTVNATAKRLGLKTAHEMKGKHTFSHTPTDDKQKRPIYTSVSVCTKVCVCVCR